MTSSEHLMQLGMRKRRLYCILICVMFYTDNYCCTIFVWWHPRRTLKLILFQFAFIFLTFEDKGFIANRARGHFTAFLDIPAYSVWRIYSETSIRPKSYHFEYKSPYIIMKLVCTAPRFRLANIQQISLHAVGCHEFTMRTWLIKP